MFRTPFRSLKQDRQGATAVEFALVSPVVVAILAGMVQFGMGYFIKNHMQDVARDTTRQFAVGSLSETQAEQFAQDKLLHMGINFLVDVIPPDPGVPTDENVTTVISAPLAEVTPFDFLGMFQEGTVQVSVTMRAE